MADNDLPIRIGRPALMALAGEGITSLEQLTKMTKSALARMHGVGPKAIAILEEEMKAHGHSFAKEA
jgi:hypothetical protein